MSIMNSQSVDPLFSEVGETKFAWSQNMCTTLIHTLLQKS